MIKTLLTTRVEVKRNAPNRLPKAIYAPSLSLLSKIELNMSGAPLEKAIRVSADIEGGSLSFLAILEMTAAKY